MSEIATEQPQARKKKKLRTPKGFRRRKNPNGSARRKGPSPSLVKLRKQRAAWLKQKELERTDSDILAIQGVAKLLHVAIDTVRKIPFADLPFARPGRRNLYAKEDVLRYHRTKINERRDASENSRRRRRLLDSEADSVRGRSQ
ncbi:hypothetical protein KFF05_16425 [bacterium SCSIO 12827]|nr:hypothetical protein KFF05_16425 [bacterium SCSIO 12827]